MNDRRLELVETAYNLDVAGPDWLAEISGPMRALHDAAVTAFVFEFDRVDGLPVLGDHFTENPQVAAQLQRTFAEVPVEILDLFFTIPLLAASTREVLDRRGIDIAATNIADVLAASGFADIFAMSAFGPLGAGVSIGVGLGERFAASEGQRRAWSQIAAHLAAGHRLRRKLGASKAVDLAEAVLSTEGKLEHAESGVIDHGLCEVLKQAVARVERARVRGRDAEEALALWQSLIAGEWSLADHFEGNGRRFYVAVRNPPEVAENKALTRREAEVVSYVACGTKTAAAAYALGLDVGTVRGYLHTAMTKLGIGSRTELMAIRAMLLAQGGREQPHA